MKITVRNTDGRLGTGVSAIEYTTQKDGSVSKTVRTQSSSQIPAARTEKDPEAASQAGTTPAAKAKRISAGAAVNRVEGLPSARPSSTALRNQLRQAQADLDTDAIMRLNRQLKEERARRGQQTFGDRASDVLSAAFGGSGAGLANLAGMGSSYAQDRAYNQRQAARLQAFLETGRSSDGKPLSDGQRETIRAAIDRLNKGENPYYQAADRMADTGAAFQESAKKGLGSVGSTVVDAAVSTGQSLLDSALGAATGTGMLPFAARAFGGAAQEARRGGADLDQQLTYGSAQAAKEYVTEKLFGLSAPQRLIGGGSLDDAIETGIRKVTERLAKTPGGQKLLGGVLTWLGGGATEALEEGIGSVIENTLINPNLRDWDPDARTRQQKFEDGLYDMLVGGVSGLMGVTNLAQYQVSPDVRARYGPSGAETGRDARLEAGRGTDASPAERVPEAALTGPENIFTRTAQKEAAPGTGTADRTLVQRVREAIPQTKNMAPVAELTGTEIPSGGKIADRLVQFINRIGGKVTRPGFGDVLFSRGRIKSAMVGHGVGQSKIDTFAAVPAVIQNGIQIDQQRNWKGRNYDTYTFAAPVTYQGQRTILGVIVTKDTQSSRYYVHEVVDADGNLLFKNNEVPLSAPDGTSALSGDLDTVTDKRTSVEGTSSLNVDSTIPQGADSVKPGIMERELQRLFGGGKRLSPDTLTAGQRAAVEAANEQGAVDMDAENRVYQVNPEEHIDRRDVQSVGDKRVRAFQFDHPQLHPYYAQTAKTLAAELEHYIPGGETASRVSEDGNAYSYRMSRSATSRIAELIDRYGVSPSQIGDAIGAIIQDRGQENYAAAKRLELLLDDMLSNGYQDAVTGAFVPANQEYLSLKREIAGAADGPANPGSGLDGIGAADAGSLNSDYDRLQAQSARFHPEGANAARPVDVPVRDFEGYNIPKSASTMMGAASLHDENVRQLEQMVADGTLSFGTIHDGDALLYADKILRGKGFDAALEQYRNDVRANVATKGNTALGQLLMRDAAALGNTDALAEIFSLYAANSTTIAQAMQARSMLRKLPSESQLVTMQRALDTLNEKYQLDLTMDPADVRDFMEAETQEARETVRQRMAEKAAKEVPSTFRAKYDAVRYLAMLGNPKTHIRNIIGNLAFQAPAAVKNRVGALAELGAQALGADVERTKSLTGANPFGTLAREARADWANAKPFLEGGKYSEGQTTAGAIEREVRPFQNSSALGKAVGWAAEKNGDLLEWEDTLFKQWIYSQSLAGYLQANGVKSISEADPALLSRARNYAAQEALRNTFNDKNSFSDWIARAGNARNSKNPCAKGASYVVEGVLPFKRTPANVLARAVEYSPVGALTDMGKLFYRAKTGKATRETLARDLDRLAAGLSGSVLLGLGVLLSGSITGGEDPDEDQRRFDDLTGHQSYALELDNGKSITLDWLAPSAIPFFMGVELAHAMQDGGLTPEEALNALKGIGEPMLEMSMLQGLSDVFENAAYAQQHGGSVIGSALVSAATNYLTQAVPTLFGQAERSAEDRRMTTYADENSGVPKDVQFFLGKLSQKVPGWDYGQIPYLDAWGREEETGDPVKRVFNNFFNPAYVSQVRVDQVERELQRVKDATGDGNVFPSRAARYFTVNQERKDLTAEEYRKYAQKRGQTALEVLRSMLDTPLYQNLNDEKKAEAISDAYSYADAIGKMAVSEYRPGDGTVAAGALKTLLPPSGYILYRLTRDRDGDGKVTNLESTQTLQELPGLSAGQRGQAWAAMNETTTPAKNPFTGVLAEQGLTPEEAVSAWSIYGGSGTKEDPYTKAEKKRDLRDELDLTDQEVNRLWNLMVKAAERK